jgi:hypothetical protein
VEVLYLLGIICIRFSFFPSVGFYLYLFSSWEMKTLIQAILVAALSFQFIFCFAAEKMLKERRLLRANERNQFVTNTSEHSHFLESHVLTNPHRSISLASASPNLFMQVIAGTGTAGYSGDNGQANSAQISAYLPWVDPLGKYLQP